MGGAGPGLGFAGPAGSLVLDGPAVHTRVHLSCVVAVTGIIIVGRYTC